ncbi:MAG: FAD:protein FMN transferase [Lachnospiraceae bacterium]|nr:FAD:protein FMN transferase [Lachnospiraceae bacterium]
MKKTGFYWALLLIPLLLTGCAGRQEAYSKTDFYFDTVVTITLYGSPSQKGKTEKLLDDTMEQCAFYDSLFAPDDPQSDIYKINHAAGEAVQVSEDTATMLYAANRFCETTNGMIDITIYPVKELWDFSNPQTAAVPPASRLEKALAHVDYTALEIDGTRVRLSDPEAAIDPGFIAKGYIADQLKKFLLEKGVENAIINLGGNVQCIGNKPDKTGYQVGIQKPFADPGVFEETVTAMDERGSHSCVVTSGTYERCFTMGDTLYHHILDPTTGMPVDTDLDSATILADSATEADALSTTCLILGSEKAMEYIESIDDIDGIFIKKDGTVLRTD